ncbi:MAG: DUF3987 domain-containing protein [Chitinophagales bacterium]
MDPFTESLLRNHSYEVFNFYLKAFNRNRPLIAGKNFSNPFLKERQKTPSFNIYLPKSKYTWLYHDFATGEKGNCIELVKRLFQLPFKEAIEKIKADLPEIDSLKAIPLSKPLKASVSFGNQNIQLPLTSDFTVEELEYWKSFGVTSEILKEYEVFALGENNFLGDKLNSLGFAYKYGSAYKVYKPFSLSNRFYFKGQKPENFYFGFDQLPDSGEYVILTGGEKDVLSLKANGFPAMCLNSETALPTDSLIKTLKERFDEILVLYDNDETGNTKSLQLAKGFSLTRIELPLKESLKDISDFFKAKWPAPELEKIISDALRNEPGTPASGKLSTWSNIADSPTVKNASYEKMPKFIQDICLVHTDERSRDVALFSALPLLSGCLPNIEGTYAQRNYTPHLYSFIIAPPASGKGNAGLIRLIGEQIEATIMADYKAAYKKFKDDLREYKRNKENPDIPEPEKPKRRCLVLPGNASSSALLDKLEQNGGKGIIFESEADSAGNAFKNDWGNYSDMLRKAFHHETISCLRKSEPQFIEISHPAIAMCLTSTISQVGSIIKSAEDGLFSRIMFYVFASPPQWIDVSPQEDSINLNQHYSQLGRKMKDIYDHYITHLVTFELTPGQWKDLNVFCEKALKEITALIDDNAASIVKRLGLIWFRMATIFTAIRAFEGGQVSKVLTCSDSDFYACRDLFEVLLDHAKRVYVNLPKQSLQLDPAKQRLYDLLPEGWFSSKEAELKGKSMGLADRTVRDYILEFRKKDLLKRGKLGQYQKPPMPGLPGLLGVKVA